MSLLCMWGWGGWILFTLRKPDHPVETTEEAVLVVPDRGEEGLN